MAHTDRVEYVNEHIQWACENLPALTGVQETCARPEGFPARVEFHVAFEVLEFPDGLDKLRSAQRVHVAKVALFLCTPGVAGGFWCGVFVFACAIGVYWMLPHNDEARYVRMLLVPSPDFCMISCGNASVFWGFPRSAAVCAVKRLVPQMFLIHPPRQCDLAMGSAAWLAASGLGICAGMSTPLLACMEQSPAAS